MHNGYRELTVQLQREKKASRSYQDLLLADTEVVKTGALNLREQFEAVKHAIEFEQLDSEVLAKVSHDQFEVAKAVTNSQHLDLQSQAKASLHNERLCSSRQLKRQTNAANATQELI